MNDTSPHTALVDCRIPPVGRVRENERVDLSESAARYPLLRGWIRPGLPRPVAPPEPKKPSRPRSRSRS